MTKFGDKPFQGAKKDKKEVTRKKSDKEKYVPITGWDPIQHDEDDGISSWIQWQREGRYIKRKPTEIDNFRNIPFEKCSDIRDSVTFETESLADHFRKNKSKQFCGEKIQDSSAIRRNSAEEHNTTQTNVSVTQRQCKSATSTTVQIHDPKTKVGYSEKQPAADNNTAKCAKNTLMSKNITADKDNVKDETEENTDEGYESKISTSDDTNDIKPVPLLNLMGVSPDEESVPTSKTPNFKWLREQDTSRVVKLTYAQNEEVIPIVHRHNIINNSREFVTNYIKRCHQTKATNGATESRPKSLFLSRVGLQDASCENVQETKNYLHSTSPELNISNLKTSSTRSASRLSAKYNSTRNNSNRVTPELKRGYTTCSDRQLPIKDLLPAVDQNIHNKQCERYPRNTVEEYYGKIGCNDPGEEVTSIEALSKSLDKHIGPPPFKPYYLRSTLHRNKEQCDRKFNPHLDGSEVYKICSPKYYVDKTASSRIGSADRQVRVRLCMLGSGSPRSSVTRGKSAQSGVKKSSERTMQTAQMIRRMLQRK